MKDSQVGLVTNGCSEYEEAVWRMLRKRQFLQRSSAIFSANRR